MTTVNPALVDRLLHRQLLPPPTTAAPIPAAPTQPLISPSRALKMLGKAMAASLLPANASPMQTAPRLVATRTLVFATQLAQSALRTARPGPVRLLLQLQPKPLQQEPVTPPTPPTQPSTPRSRALRMWGRVTVASSSLASVSRTPTVLPHAATRIPASAMLLGLWVLRTASLVQDQPVVRSSSTSRTIAFGGFVSVDGLTWLFLRLTGPSSDEMRYIGLV